MRVERAKRGGGYEKTPGKCKRLLCISILVLDPFPVDLGHRPAPRSYPPADRRGYDDYREPPRPRYDDRDRDRDYGRPRNDDYDYRRPPPAYERRDERPYPPASYREEPPRYREVPPRRAYDGYDSRAPPAAPYYRYTPMSFLIMPPHLIFSCTQRR